MATLTSVQRVILKRIFPGILFVAAIGLMNEIALRLEWIVNPTTVALEFLIIVVSSAVFAGLAVAVVVSVVATLFFNYFYLPPIGRFIVYDSHNWVALFAFLFTSVVISRLTASAKENRHKADDLEFTLGRLKEFASWLLLMPKQNVTLSRIAEGAVKIFSLEYCSIHVYAEGTWHHFTGTSVGELSREIADTLKNSEDHPTGLIELAEEQSLGVRYSRIRNSEQYIGALVVKSKHLTSQTLDAIAQIVGIALNGTTMKLLRSA